MYGFIYRTTNLINGKMYIGQRTYDKFGKWKTYLGSGTLLRRAINKYGENNFKREILEICETRQDLNNAEKKWIAKYDATQNDMYYNISSGGDGGNTIAGYTEEQLQAYKEKKSILHKKCSVKGVNSPMAQFTENQIYSIIGMLIKGKHDCEIAEWFNVRSSTIYDIRHHKTWNSITGNIKFPILSKINRGTSKKCVCQYDENGNLINRYISGVEAEKMTGVPRKLISAVCHGNKRIAYGYIWRLDGDPFDKYKTVKKGKRNE